MPELVRTNIKTGSVIAAFVVLIGWAWTTNEKATADAAANAADKARMEGQLEAIRSTTGDHESRLRATESGMREMQTDVKWIRQQMEQQARRP
jgi:TolA-binding protein